MPDSGSRKEIEQAYMGIVADTQVDCQKWERPSIPEGWEFTESSFHHISPEMGAMVTTNGDTWTTYLAFPSIQEAYQGYQFIKNNRLAAYAEIRSPAKWLNSRAELKVWLLQDEWFNKFADATAKQGN